MKINFISAAQKPIAEILRLTEEIEKISDAKIEYIHPKLDSRCANDEQFWDRVLNCDILYYRSGMGLSLKNELAKRVNKKKVFIVNKNFVTNPLISNKLYQQLQLNNEELYIPFTLYGYGYDFEEIKQKIGVPFILKKAVGMQGKGVFLINTREEYENQRCSLEGDLLIQKFICNSGDFRVLILDGQVIEIFKRVPSKNNFRANIAQGGYGEIVTDVTLRKELSAIALKVARVFDLDLIGIDLIQSTIDGKIYFIEANENPGWKGIEKFTGTNISRILAEWLISKV